MAAEYLLQIADDDYGVRPPLPHSAALSVPSNVAIGASRYGVFAAQVYVAFCYNRSMGVQRMLQLERATCRADEDPSGSKLDTLVIQLVSVSKTDEEVMRRNDDL